MGKKEKPAAIVMTDGKREIIRQLLSEYDIETAQDIQNALKDLLGGTIKEMMEVEMSRHLGYEKSERSDSDNARNGHRACEIFSVNRNSNGVKSTSRWIFTDFFPHAQIQRLLQRITYHYASIITSAGKKKILRRR